MFILCLIFSSHCQIFSTIVNANWLHAIILFWFVLLHHATFVVHLLMVHHQLVFCVIKCGYIALLQNIETSLGRDACVHVWIFSFFCFWWHICVHNGCLYVAIANMLTPKKILKFFESRFVLCSMRRIEWCVERFLSINISTSENLIQPIRKIPVMTVY